MKKISILTPTYNEETNVEIIYKRIKYEMTKLVQYEYEHIFIDNDSNDSTFKILKDIASIDNNVKIIANVRNFGHIRSPFHGILQCEGDAVITIASDLQDPTELIPVFIKKWEEGFKIIIGVKTESKENKIMFIIRKIFYNLIEKLSETKQIKNFTGFGLYDKNFIEVLRSLNEPYPYFRGLVSEFGYDVHEVEYIQPIRINGKTKNNFYTLYDIAMLGFVSYSKIPLRLSIFVGFIFSIISFIVAILYFILKFLYWDSFKLGFAPLIIGIFFLAGIQLFFLGIIGEYISVIFTQVKQRPHVVEKTRIGFNKIQ
jgi:glycosyltransferase involved in cell wall biosynthesis